MDYSIDSTNSESTVPARKNIFKRPGKTVTQTFDISLSESTIDDVMSNKADLDITSKSLKSQPFKKPNASSKQVFNVSFDGSITDSEIEKSVVQQKPLFKQVKKPAKDLFNVSYNESNRSGILSESTINKTDSTINEKSNIFRERKGTPKNISKKRKSLIHVSFTEDDEVHLKSNKTVSDELDTDKISSIDASSFLTKTNPFKKFLGRNANTEQGNYESIQESFLENDNQSTNNASSEKNLSKILESEDIEPTRVLNKSNPFKRKKDEKNKSLGNDTKQLKVTYMEDENNEVDSNEINSAYNNEVDDDENNEEEIMESKTEVLKHSERSTENIENNRNISNLTNKTTNSEMLLDQSSFNDDNLNNWMSDHSDEEDIHPPDIAPMTTNISLTKQQPQEEKVVPPQDLNSSKSWEQMFENIISKSKKPVQKIQKTVQPVIQKPHEKPVKKISAVRPPRLKKPAPFATKRLYQYVINRLKPKYGIDAVVKAEELIITICETVKVVCRRKAHQKKLIQDLKKDMAKAGLIQTTVDFNEFVIEFLPYSFRVKVVPCVQPVTNTVFPPKDVTNPFDKIL